MQGGRQTPPFVKGRQFEGTYEWLQRVQVIPTYKEAGEEVLLSTYGVQRASKWPNLQRTL